MCVCVCVQVLLTVMAIPVSAGVFEFVIKPSAISSEMQR
jgi:hypothetical protein